MKTFDLNIQRILENWEIYHGIREIIANALDEQKITNSSEIIIYCDSNNWWHIRDYGRGINVSSFTNNENDEKLSHNNLIGRFGVGLKDALATFHRNNVKVKIISKYGEFSLKEMKKHNYDFDTLHIIEAPSPDINIEGTDFMLFGCSDDDIKKAKELFLEYANAEILDVTPYGQILKKNKDYAEIFINGIRASTEPNFLFSYNITSLNAILKKSLNRERMNLGKSAYSDRIQSILKSSTSNSVLNFLMDDLRKFVSGNMHDELSKINVMFSVCEKIQKDLDHNVIFVTNNTLNSAVLMEDLKKEKDIIVIPKNVYDKISAFNALPDNKNEQIETADLFVDKKNKAFSPIIIPESSLTSDEKNLFEKKEDIIKLIFNEPLNIPVYIAEKLSEYDDVMGVYDAKNKRILINKKSMNSLKNFSGVLVHEYLHSYGLNDCTRSFENELTNCIGKLVTINYENKSIKKILKTFMIKK